MHFEREERHNPPPFRPTFTGCVAKDIHMARALEDAYCAKLYAVAADTYRSLITEAFDRTLSELFDAFAVEALWHFRLLGELILALGGNPAVRTPVRVEPREVRADESVRSSRAALRLLEDAKRDGKRMIDRLETLMGHSGDRVVRSVLAGILDDDQRRMSQINAAMP